MISTIEQGGRVVAFAWPGETARFHAIWLRDNAPETRDPHNGQKRHTLAELPADPRVVAASAGQLRFDDGFEASFHPDWLRAHRVDAPAAGRGWLCRDVETWVGGFEPFRCAWPDLADPATRRRWLTAVRRHGVARLCGVPTRPGAVADVVATFGFVRETNYGRTFEVRSRAAPDNLADTALALAAHTDNAYREPAPTLQLLLCRANDVAGGESRVVDGFAVAHALRAEDPAAFDTLASVPASWSYAGSPGVRLSARRPMLDVGPDGELRAVRHNDRATAPLDAPFHVVPAWYAAARTFAAIVERPAMGVTFRLAPGDLFIVDNIRVLHARTAFSGAGERLLEGCYADRDGLLSSLAALETSR